MPEMTKIMDADELASLVLGVSAHLDEQVGHPVAALHINRVQVPGHGLAQVARVAGPRASDGDGYRRPVVRVAVVDAHRLPGGPVWVWRSLDDGDDDPELLYETSAANVDKYDGPTGLLLHYAQAELRRLLPATGPEGAARAADA